MDSISLITKRYEVSPFYVYILYGSRSRQDARARPRRAASGAATPSCLSWADRAPPAPPFALSHQPLRVVRARRLLILVVLVCDIMCGVSGKVCVDQNGKNVGCPRVPFPRMVKVWGLR